MLKYVTVSDLTEEEGENGGITRCGIAVYQNDCLIDCIADITPDPAEAAQLAEQLNRFEASPLHFRDIVEDHLAYFSFPEKKS